MSNLYGTIIPDMAKTNATRRSRNNITVAAQSWGGSVIVDMKHTSEGKTLVCISVNEGSETRGRALWQGPIEELLKASELFADVLKPTTSRA